MMKKFFIVCLAVAMLCTNAFAATWADGLSPQKPYSGTPEVDFNETIGYMMLFPLNGESVGEELDTLSIFMPREDVITGEGTLYLHSKEDGVVEEIAVTAETMPARPMTEEELDALLWGCGTVFEIRLAQPLEINRNYFVQLTQGCIVSPDFEAVSPAIAGEAAWYFDTVTLNYIESISYTRVVEGEAEPQTVESVQVGDSANISIVVGEDAAYAVIFCDTGVIVPAVSYFEASAETTVNFSANGIAEWGVAFFDAEDNLVYIQNVVTEVNAAE